MSADATSAEWCLFIRAFTELRYHILVFVEFVMSPEILDVDIVGVLAVDVSHLLLEITFTWHTPSDVTILKHRNCF